MQKILTDTFTGDDTMTIADLIVDSIQDIKGKNLIKIDLRHLEMRLPIFSSFVKEIPTLR